LIKWYKNKIENELNEIARECILLLDAELIPKSGGQTDARVFYMKMKGDYFRYLCEFLSGEK
jgi:14-3-3 protein epsilon